MKRFADQANKNEQPQGLEVSFYKPALARNMGIEPTVLTTNLGYKQYESLVKSVMVNRKLEDNQIFALLNSYNFLNNSVIEQCHKELKSINVKFVSLMEKIHSPDNEEFIFDSATSLVMFDKIVLRAHPQVRERDVRTFCSK